MVRPQLWLCLGLTPFIQSPEILNLFVDLYRQADNKRLKKRLINAIGRNRSKEAVTHMIDIARQEKDPSIKKSLIFWLSQSKDEAALKFLKEILEK